MFCRQLDVAKLLSLTLTEQIGLINFKVRTIIIETELIKTEVYQSKYLRKDLEPKFQGTLHLRKFFLLK